MGMRRLGLIAFVLVCGLAALAGADTGGSMGGGDWGGGGGGGYSSGGDSSSSNSYSYSSSDDSYSGGGSLSGVALAVILLVCGVIWFAATVATSGGTSQLRAAGVSDFSAADVSVLRIALDGRARRFVQGELARIAKSADTRTADGRLTMLREVELLLRRARDAWVYGGAINEAMRSLEGTKVVFDKHVSDTRARFRIETVRNTQGIVTTAEAPASSPRSHEGAGLILVSIIVAARTELFTVRHIADGEDLRKALEAASHRAASDLIAIEIVWQPSEDGDRLSSIELEAKYPPPALIPITGALVGKAFCTYCGGPFPAELVTCPHCGAPAPGHEPAVSRAA